MEQLTVPLVGVFVAAAFAYVVAEATGILRGYFADRRIVRRQRAAEARYQEIVQEWELAGRVGLPIISDGLYLQRGRLPWGINGLELGEFVDAPDYDATIPYRWPDGTFRCPIGGGI